MAGDYYYWDSQAQQAAINAQQQAFEAQMQGLRNMYQTINGTAYLNNPYNAKASYVPPELEEEGFEPIQGNPEGAKFIVSYCFKEPKDPVVFLKTEDEMKALVKKLMEDDKVDQKTILITKIAAQFKPKKAHWIEKLIKVKEYDLEPLKKGSKK